MAKKDVSGIILAGGHSRRLGMDKAFLPWEGRTLIEHVMETLRPVVDEVLVVVKDVRRFRHLDGTIVADRVPDAHALGGLYTGLRLARHARCFVCACDAPFLNPRLIRFLAEQAPQDDLVIPQTARGLQPLHAVYAKTVLPVIEEQLRIRQWDLKALVPRVRAHIVSAERLCQCDPEDRSFFNLNTLADYMTALGIAEGARGSDHG